jgi:hypothetical protein
MQDDAWPALPLAGWQKTCATLQLWTQIVGKVRLALAPMANHWWQAPLYVTARGLTTSPMPWRGGAVQIDFDFIDHRLAITTSGGRQSLLALEPRSTADFHRAVMSQLAALGIEVSIWAMPVEIPDAIPFNEDRIHGDYDPVYVNRFWRVLVQCDRLFKEFRCGFLGKASPVHFFWGSFDLAVTRFSGRAAPPHPGGAPNLGDWVMHEAYSHEVSSCGFWPGYSAVAGGVGGDALFYSYAYPSPPDFAKARIRPDAARWEEGLGEFVLPYEAARNSITPDTAILDFLESSYAAAADLGRWDRVSLERPRDAKP